MRIIHCILWFTFPSTSICNEKFISGVSGLRFCGAVKRNVGVEDFKFTGYRHLETDKLEGRHCEKWIVLTTIFPPSDSTRLLGEMTERGWCCVVVADKNGPNEYNVDGIFYLTVQKQQMLHFRVLDHMPWKHFGRKNIGFLWAISHGARVIYDTDDDNKLKALDIPILDEKVTTHVEQPKVFQHKAYNPYSHFQPSCEHIWPRGYPLDLLQTDLNTNLSELHTVVITKPPAVQQFLVDRDPDVDAVFRLTRHMPCFFNESGSSGTRFPDPLVLPKTVFAPYNAQSSIHLYESFWGLLLPVTVHGRVSDIWRAYLVQRLLWDVEQVVAFRPTYVVHERVGHDSLKDFDSEQDLYLKTSAMLNFLSEWRSNASTLVERIEQLWVELFQRGFVEEADYRLAQAWISDLLSLGYDFPRIPENTPEVCEDSAFTSIRCKRVNN